MLEARFREPTLARLDGSDGQARLTDAAGQGGVAVSRPCARPHIS